MPGGKEFNVDLDVRGKIKLKDVPNNTPTGFLVWNSEIKDIAQRTSAQLISDLGLITATSIAAAYYTKTQLQTSGQSSVHWNNISNKPSTFPATAHTHSFAALTGKPNSLAGYGILDAYTKVQTDANITTAVDAIRIGGRNYFKKSTIIYYYDGSEDLGRTETGFKVLGVVANTGTVRIAGVIDSNGYWTVSFEHQISYAGYSLQVDICDQGTQYLLNSTNEWTKHVVTVNVTNVSDVFNFVDISGLTGQEHRFRNVKIEKGNKATDWTPAPEDQVSNWNTTDVNDFSFIKNKPTKLSQFTNDAGYLTSTALSPYAQTSWVNANFDKYSSWNLKTDGVQRIAVTSGGTLDVKGGTNVSVSYGAGGAVTISAVNTDTNTTYSPGDGISITGPTNVITNTKPNIVQTLSGSGNTINLSNGGSHTIPAQSWGSITGKPEFNLLPSNPQLIYGASGLNYFNISGVVGNNPAINQAPTDAWHHIIRMNHKNSDGYYADLAISMVDNSGISRRVIVDGAALSDWVKIWDSTHFTQANITNWNTAVGWGDHAGLYAPINHSHTVLNVHSVFTQTVDTPVGVGLTTAFVDINSGYGSYGSVLNLNTYPDSNGGALQLYVPYADNYGGTGLKYRKFNYGGTWGSIKTLWDSGNLTKLSQLSNDVGYLTSMPTHSHSEYVTLGTAQTITGVKTFSGSITAQSFVKTGGTANDILMANGTTILKSSITGTTYTAGTLAEINAGTNATRVWTPLVLRDSLVTLGTTQTITGTKTFNQSITAPSFLEGSLRSLKTNIKPFEKSGLELVNELEIVTFDRKDKSVKNKIGIIADDSPKEFLSEELDAVDLYKTVFIQAKAIQELKSEVDELKEIVKQLLNK